MTLQRKSEKGGEICPKKCRTKKKEKKREEEEEAVLGLSEP